MRNWTRTFYDLIGFGSTDIVDSYFIESSLVDINLTEEEKAHNAFFDSQALNTSSSNTDMPIGKQVW